MHGMARCSPETCGQWNRPEPGRKQQKLTQANQSANRFEVVTRAWFAKESPALNPAHAERVIRRFERDLFPWIGIRPIAEITAPELLANQSLDLTLIVALGRAAELVGEQIVAL